VAAKTTTTKKPAKAKKTKVTKAALEAAPVVIAPVIADGPTSVTEQVFLTRLREKLSHFDAEMVLEAAMLSAGVTRRTGCLQKLETRSICLALIKRGGPAFSVGTNIYKEVMR
jgi:hypothetical protein